jgi:23S rRNA pseudouridine2605 synthase
VQERLQKILSRAGVASRRAAETAIREGRVSVNGSTVLELGSKADPESDEIRVDGKRLLPPAAPVYLLLNKPKGVVTTRKDPSGRPTVMELVPKLRGLFPVGRLDVSTEGLLLLTNDGDFAERVAHPRFGVIRTYRAKVHRVPTPATLGRLVKGVRVDGERLAFDRVRVLEGGGSNPWIEVQVHEGKNREVRRVLESVGHPVAKLRRVGLGPLTDRGLGVGRWRELTDLEVRRLCGRARARGKKSAPRSGIPRKPGHR